MLTYPVITGNTGVDEQIFLRLHQGARSQNLNENETQHCMVTFARRMLHSLGERKAAGESMAGAEFVEWLENSAQNHPSYFRQTYHSVGAPSHWTGGYASQFGHMTHFMSSKDSEIGAMESDEVMLSDYDGVLASAACQLTPSSRLIVLWHYFGGISVAEIAAKVGITETAVRKRIVRAGREMQLVLARRGYATVKNSEFAPHEGLSARVAA